ncbi:MAG TPA: hypothetical protein VGL56_17630 [Fimbriimonadaceae bacterium]
MSKKFSNILIGGILAAGLAGCQKGATSSDAAQSSPPPTASSKFVGTWKHVASGSESNATLTFNSDGTMSFTASNGPKLQPYSEKGIGKWDANGNQLSMTPLSIEIQTPSPATTAKLMPYVKKQEKVRSSAPVIWKGNDEFVVTRDKADQDFQRVK